MAAQFPAGDKIVAIDAKSGYRNCPPASYPLHWTD